MQQAAVQGNSSTDNLRNASVTEEQKKKDIKQKAIKDATEGKKNTNADVDLKVQLWDDETDEPFEVDLPINVNFFWPDA